MKRRQFVVAFPLLACSSAFAQNENVNGVYELRVPQEAKPDAMKFVMLWKSGADLIVRDLATGQDYKGRITGTNVTFNLFLNTPAWPPVAMTTPHLFVGAVTQTGLAGHVQAGDAKMEWVANRLTSLWLCSNHRPKPHIAKSKDEMVTYTKTYKCEGWSRARPESLG